MSNFGTSSATAIIKCDATTRIETGTSIVTSRLIEPITPEGDRSDATCRRDPAKQRYSTAIIPVARNRPTQKLPRFSRKCPIAQRDRNLDVRQTPSGPQISSEISENLRQFGDAARAFSRKVSGAVSLYARLTISPSDDEQQQSSSTWQARI